MTRIDDLYFGNANGDMESKRPEFENLFYKGNNKYRTIMFDKTKFIVSGQKGTGKTIMGKYIDYTCKKENRSCKILNRNDLLLHKLIELENIDLNKDDYAAFYIWFILRELSKVIISTNVNTKNKSLLDKILIKIKYSYYKFKLKRFFDIRYDKNGNYGCEKYDSSGEATGKGTVFSLVKKFNATKIKKKFYKVIEPVKELVYKCMRYNDIILILDDLDELDTSKKLNEETSLLIINLINAIREINEDLYNISKDSLSKIILLIRTDILDTINKHSSNLAKIRTDSEVNLYWIDKKEEPTQHMLMQMIIHKIRQTAIEFKDKDDNDIYEKLFPEYIDKKDMVTYLIDYSFGRPRDIITYLNIIKDKFGDKDKFLSGMFTECRSDYSLAFKRELYNELCIHKDANYTDELFQLLSDYGKRTFKFEQIRYYYDNNKDSYPHIKSLEECINICYRFGILGNSRRNTSKKKNAPKYLYSWAYRKDGNSNANFDISFTVHFGLRKALSL